MMKALNLGCGPRLFPPPWVNADLLPYIRADVVMDAEKVWPWEDNTFDQVWANMVAEHCLDKAHFIEELWRVCKSGAFVQITVPIYTWPPFWNDLTHKSCWTPGSLNAVLIEEGGHSAQRFRDTEFSRKAFEQRDWALCWDLEVVKKGIPRCASAPIELPPNAQG